MTDPNSVSFVTLGCAKNEVDSEHMQAALAAAGFALADDPAEAGFIVVNTCSFITEATEESIAAILEAADLAGVRAGTTRLIVSGCLPSRYGAELPGQLPEVAAFVPVAEEERLVEVLRGLAGAAGGTAGAAGAAGGAAKTKGEKSSRLSGPAGADAADDPVEGPVGTSDEKRSQTAVLAGNSVGAGGQRHRRLPGQQVWAYLKIAEGCSRNCSYCTIPSIRGPYTSYDEAAILAEAAELVAAGVRELVLIAQDTGRWKPDGGAVSGDAGGSGQPGRAASGLSGSPANGQPDDGTPASGLTGAPASGLPGLLQKLAVKHPQTWLRVLYLQPNGISDELLAVMAAHPNICNYLDIPLQHAAPRVLREMNRSGSGTEFLELIGRIRARLADVCLRTTVMAGFCGETRAEARELECFIEAAGFDYVGVFSYSPEEGTAAGGRADQVPAATRRARAQRLRDLADRVSLAKAAERAGSEADVLICSEEADESGRYLLGRTQGMAPEVDAEVRIELAADGEGTDDVRPGDIVRVCLTDTFGYEWEGRVIQP